jgi:hypothetical protein
MCVRGGHPELGAPHGRAARRAGVIQRGQEYPQSRLSGQREHRAQRVSGTPHSENIVALVRCGFHRADPATEARHGIAPVHTDRPSSHLWVVHHE